jgi:hypothetical protein
MPQKKVYPLEKNFFADWFQKKRTIGGRRSGRGGGDSKRARSELKAPQVHALSHVKSDFDPKKEVSNMGKRIHIYFL